MTKACKCIGYIIGVSVIIVMRLYTSLTPYSKEKVVIDPHFKLDTKANFTLDTKANFTLDTKASIIYNSSQPLGIEPWIDRTDQKLKVGLTVTQHKELIDLLEEFAQLMDKHNITYVMYDGTLLGSYFFHNIIPWDDDIDMMVAFTDRPKLVKLFSDKKFRKIYGIHSFQDAIDWYSFETLEGRNPKLQNPTDFAKYSKQTDYKFKFYRESSKTAGKYPWKWPFIDVNFYKEEGGKIIKLYSFRGKHDTVDAKDFLPLHYRPFGRLWLPAPRDTRKCLQEKYKTFNCRSHTWDHIHEKGKTPIKVSCESLVGVYPHVHRAKVEKTEDGGGVKVGKTEDGGGVKVGKTEDGGGVKVGKTEDGGGVKVGKIQEEDGGVIESLMLGEKVLHHALVYEPWYKARGYFDFK